MNFKSILVFFSVLVCFCSSLLIANETKDAVTLPSVNDDMKKLKVLMAIYEEVPEIFSDAARFETDLFSLIDDQEKLQKLLNTNSDFQRLWNEKKYQEFDFQIKSDKGVVEYKQITDLAVSSWKNKIKSLLIENKKIDLKKEIKKILLELGEMSSSGVLNGLILSLPKEMQVKARELQKNKEEDKLLTFLQAQLTDTLSGFKGDGLKDNPKRDDLLKMYKELAIKEDKLGHLVDAYSFTMERNVNPEELLQDIDSLDRQDLENLSDIDYQKKIFEKLLDNSNNKPPSAYLKYLKSYTSQTEVVSTEIKHGYKVTIKEQNPNIAVFRGCTAGDCSSQYSFPYPNDPNERVFFIYDDQGKLKGYVSATMIDVGKNEQSLYVITIAGNRVHAMDTEVILQGLYKEREALGAKNIILPESKKLYRLLNFSPVRSVYQKSVEGQPAVEISYRNKDIRQAIEKFESSFNHGNYDHASNNTSGVIYTPKEESKIDLLIRAHFKTSLNA